VTTFSLGNPTIPHAAFLFLMFINVFFLIVEARRFRVYEAARYRVLLLEHYFYPEVLGESSPRDWRPALIEALRTPYSYPPVGMPMLAKRRYPMGSEAAQAVLRQEPD